LNHNTVRQQQPSFSIKTYPTPPLSLTQGSLSFSFTFRLFISTWIVLSGRTCNTVAANKSKYMRSVF